jgi:hypothetical protein
MPLINTRGAASIKGFGFAGFSPKLPGIPTIGTATATGSSSATISFTAPACTGGVPIDYYQAISSPGCITATGTSPISVTGLTYSTSYTFKVRAHNVVGYGCYSSSSGSITTCRPTGSAVYTSTGSYTWVAPSGVCKVSAMVVGGGGAGSRTMYCYGPPCGYWFSYGGQGGSTAFTNQRTVGSGTSYKVVVGGGGSGCAARGGFSFFGDVGGCAAYSYDHTHIMPAGILGSGGNYCPIYASGGSFYGGNGWGSSSTLVGTQGGYSNNSAGAGGPGGCARCGNSHGWLKYGGGGGAGGYPNVWNGSVYYPSGRTCCQACGGQGQSPLSGSNLGSGAGGSYNSNGGGIGLYGRGSGGSYGYGSTYGSTGGQGGVHIVWPGCTRQYPSTSVCS